MHLIGVLLTSAAWAFHGGGGPLTAMQVPGRYAATVLATSPAPAVYLKLDDANAAAGMADSSANAYPGTWSGSGITFRQPTLVTTGSYSIILPGAATDFGAVTANAALDFSNGGTVIWTHAMTVAQKFQIAQLNSGPSGWWIQGYSTVIQFRGYTAGGTNSYTVSLPAQDGTRRMDAITWASKTNGTVLLYENNVNYATQGGNTTFTSHTEQPIRVGLNNAAFGDVGSGNIDEIAIWTSALTAAQISQLWTDGK